ncbi:hypothetical protein [Flagellimonas lutaonensis]|uniref:Lipoprotein n=1 Tax=Flagellimonas lutaonensis TaxID=516051 RepID=A0A0D5YQL0_9FLAO|nr:hypothetical protein [Allomuricauda lutaonensis]AKA34214.1 hypothetical protein VC82_539 [Allomuricauda lutaonensis]
MKHIAFFSMFLLLVLLGSCQPPVVFGEPQPADTESLAQIPEAYWGVYWCNADSASLFVDRHAFVKRKEIFVKLTETEIAESPELQLLNGELHVNGWGQSFPMEQKGDTIISTVVLRDTLFAIGGHQVLKQLKGHLILNKKLDENTWAVLVASQKDDILSLAQADLPEDLSRLKGITPVKALANDNDEKTQIFITPTKEEFEQILNERLLFESSCSVFERVIPSSIPLQ